jgi:hypothetical protein
MRLRRIAQKSARSVLRVFRGRLPTLSADEREHLRSLCLFLGPYRNLTTLTASILALHPNCQVLNHAGERVLEDPRLNFLSNYSDDRFYAFCRFAIDESQGGKHGDHGGSITLSHAFDYPKMQEVYERRFGTSLLREDLRSIAWKESLRVANHLRGRDGAIEALLDHNARIRFLMPVRNPMDCAVSNRKTGHARHFRGLRETAGVAEILAAFLEEYSWFARLEDRFPGRFFSFLEREVDEGALRRLAGFLDLDAPETWVCDALEVYDVTGKYTHPPDLKSHYESLVGEHFDWSPGLRERLLRFADH